MSAPPETLPRHVLERKLRRSRLYNLVLGVIAAAGLVFFGVQVISPGAANDLGSVETPREAGQSPQTTESSVAEMPHVRNVEGDSMAIGSIDAPVVLSEWIDFRCPYCAVFSRDTYPQIIDEYVNRGLVRIEINDVAYFGDDSARAAAAARAAGEQGRYFEFMEALYRAAPESGHADLPLQTLVEFASEAGVADIGQFKSDMQSDDLLAAVQASTSEAQQLGVTGVPFFVVGQQAISGAQPIENFRQLLDQQIAGS